MHLPIKYLVVETYKKNIVLDQYKKRYNFQLMMRLAKACDTVADHPRHNK